MAHITAQQGINRRKHEAMVAAEALRSGHSHHLRSMTPSHYGRRLGGQTHTKREFKDRDAAPFFGGGHGGGGGSSSGGGSVSQSVSLVSGESV